MDWINSFKDWSDRLWKKEAPSSEFESYYRRVDLESFFGNLNNLWEPNELINMIGGYRRLNKIMIDPEVYAAFDQRKAAVIDTKLIIECDNEENKAFIEEQILEHEDQLKKDFFSAVPYGYSVEQILYDPDRSCKVIGFQKEDFWRFQPMQDLIHVKVVDSPNFSYVNKLMPYGKWVLTTNDGSYNNPYGDAVIEKLIQPWLFRCTDWDLWMDFAKRFANGFMHAKIDDPAQAKEVKEELAKAAKGAILVTDKNSELNLITASRDSSMYAEIDDRVIASIQKVVLGQTMTSDMQERGSSGAASVQNDIRIEKFRSDVKLIEKGFNDTIKQIAYVCGMDGEIPTAKLITDVGLNTEQATRDLTLSNIGLKFSKEYFISNYGFHEDDFEIVDKPQSFFKPEFSKKNTYLSADDIKQYLGVDANCLDCGQFSQTKRSLKLSPSVKRKQNKNVEQREDTVSFLKRNGEAPLNPDDLVAAIMSSKSEKELDEKLLSMFGQDNPNFTDLLTNTLYHSAAQGALFGNPDKLDPEDIK